MLYCVFVCCLFVFVVYVDLIVCVSVVLNNLMLLCVMCVFICVVSDVIGVVLSIIIDWCLSGVGF